MSEREPSASSSEIAERLAELGIRHALIGCVAASLHRATERMTTDVDFLADDRDDIRSVLAAVAVDVDYIERWAAVWDIADRWAEALGWVGEA